jgi:hypothetical protein
MSVQDYRDQKLQQYTVSLQRMGELVDFENVAAAVDAACPRADRSKGGRPPYPTGMMMRVLFLQALYNLSDEQAEHQLLDRRSFQQFCGLANDLRIPDARTIWLFKQCWRRPKTGSDALCVTPPGAGASSLPCWCGRRSESAQFRWWRARF